MTKETARIIYEDWKGNIEILDKIFKIFGVVPESFLPYSAEILEEALNIIAKDYFDAGDKRTSENIENLMIMHMAGLYSTPDGATVRKMSDEEALLCMKEKLDLLYKYPELKKGALNNLKEAQESWSKLKQLG